MTTNQNLKPYLSALAALRLCCRQRALEPEDMQAQDMIYARALAKYDLRDVKAACGEWVERETWFPELACLLKLVRENEAIREAAARPKLEAPSEERVKALGDEETLAQWRRNDALYAQIRTTPEVAGASRDTLLRIADSMRAKRWSERPDLAARYYGEREAAE